MLRISALVTPLGRQIWSRAGAILGRDWDRPGRAGSEQVNGVELDESDGMPRACVTSLDNLSTIAKGQLVEKITVVGPAKMGELCRALGATVACASI